MTIHYLALDVHCGFSEIKLPRDLPHRAAADKPVANGQDLRGGHVLSLAEERRAW